jgi:hypothetical protein
MGCHFVQGNISGQSDILFPVKIQPGVTLVGNGTLITLQYLCAGEGGAFITDILLTSRASFTSKEIVK